MREILERKSAAVAGALILSVALGLFFAACDHKSKIPVRGADGMFVMEDFESPGAGSSTRTGRRHPIPLRAIPAFLSISRIRPRASSRR